MGDFGESESEQTTVSTVTPEPASEEEKRLQDLVNQLAELQLEQVLFEQQARAAAFTPEELERFEQGEVRRLREMGVSADQLQQLQMRNLMYGGAATPEEKRLIAESFGAALEGGLSDIEASERKGFELLRTELGPRRGLRTGDTPMIAEGFKISEEAGRQKGQLIRGLRGQQAAAELNFPLQRQGTTTPLAQGAAEFQAQLKQQAFFNRQAMLGSEPAALAGLRGFRLDTATRTQVGSGTVQQSPAQTFGQVSSGLGGLMLGAAALSSRALKYVLASVDPAEALELVKTLPVERWAYKGDTEQHIGPYAEDLHDAFAVGNRKTINYLDGIGILMAAVKELARRQEDGKAIGD